MTIKMALQNFIMSIAKKSFFMKLISSNTGVSSKNFFLVCTTIIGMILLGVLIAGMIVDIIFQHTITISIGYQDGEYDIHKLKLDKTDVAKADAKRDSIKQAGILAQSIIKHLEEQSGISKNIKFLVVIEGQSSKIPYYENDWKNNETLSFLRAKFLRKFWTDPVEQGGCGLFQKTSANDSDSKCEIIIAGSGEGGVPRYYYSGDDNSASLNPEDEKFESFDIAKKASPDEFRSWYNVEIKNQRFLINIIPIIGNIDVKKSQMENINY